MDPGLSAGQPQGAAKGRAGRRLQSAWLSLSWDLSTHRPGSGRGPAAAVTGGQQRLFRCSLIQGEQSAAPHTRHLNRLARSCRQVAQSIPPLWVIHEFAGASTGWAAPQWGGTMIPLRCRAAPLREPLSQRVRPAGCPTEARLLRRCQRWGVAGAALDTVAFAEESVRQPPSLVAQAKEMGLQRRLPGKSPNSVGPVKGDWPEPVAQCFAASLAEDNGVSGPTGIMFRL